jgi:hypothetical protein
MFLPYMAVPIVAVTLAVGAVVVHLTAQSAYRRSSIMMPPPTPPPP